MSSVGSWDEHYEVLTEHYMYGGSDMTYRIGAEFLSDCNKVEDWGCGGGWLRRYISTDIYWGIDGSASPFANEIADLADPREPIEGIFMRHVLEHNYNWAEILDNAVNTFTKKLYIVLFTWLTEETHVEFTEPDYHDVPVIAFQLNDLVSRIPNPWTLHQITNPNGTLETILKVTK